MPKTLQERIAVAEARLQKATEKRKRADLLACQATSRLSDAEEAEAKARTALQRLRGNTWRECGAVSDISGLRCERQEHPATEQHRRGDVVW
jgi:hypothetical protein